MHQFIRKNNFSFAAEVVIRDDISASIGGKKLAVVLKKRRQNLKTVAKEASINNTLVLEKSHLEEELEKFAGSPAHKSSLKEAIKQIAIIESLLDLVRDPKAYQNAARSYQIEKSRRNNLPDDSARIAFRAHKTRLGNTDRSRMDDNERKVLDLRRKNMGIAEKAYIALQETALEAA